jgi:hypothetical protein
MKRQIRGVGVACEARNAQQLRCIDEQTFSVQRARKNNALEHNCSSVEGPTIYCKRRSMIDFVYVTASIHPYHVWIREKVTKVRKTEIETFPLCVNIA